MADPTTESPVELDDDAVDDPPIWRRYRGRIFVSYRRAGTDILFARNVKYELERVYGSRSIFFDEEHLEGGDAWRAIIRRECGRRGKPWVVFCVGSSWSPSDGVRYEIEQVKRHGLAATLVLDSEASLTRALDLADACEQGEQTAAWLRSRKPNVIGVGELGRELRRCVVGGNLRWAWPRRRRVATNGAVVLFAMSLVSAIAWFGASSLQRADPGCDVSEACELGARLGSSWQLVDELADPVPPFDDVCEGHSVAGVARSVDFLSNESEGAIAVQRVDVGSTANAQARWAELQTWVRECAGDVDSDGPTLRITVIHQLLPYQRSFWIDGTNLVGTSYRSYNDRPSEWISGRIDVVAEGSP